MLLVVNKALCCACEECIAVCPVGAVRLGDDGKAQIDAASCVRCGACLGECPQGVITTKPEEK